MDGTELEARVKGFDRFAVISIRTAPITWSSSTPSRPSAPRARRPASCAARTPGAVPRTTLMTTSPFRRVFVIVIDSLGVGALPDAAAYATRAATPWGTSRPGAASYSDPGRTGDLPRRALAACRCRRAARRVRAHGRGLARQGLVTGHWELMGLQLAQAFPTSGRVSEDAMREYERRIGRRTLGNIVASGTQIIDELGPEAMKTGWPIIYTSADSVFQIAAHEDVIPVADLYRMCEVAYGQFVEGMGLGRVIARPFVGSRARSAAPRTARLPIPPAADTLLDV